MRSLFLGVAMLGLAIGGEVLAQSPDYMMEDCRNNSQIFFQDFDARSVPKYEGQRTDGTHAVNGTIYRRGGEMTYQCSYNAAGNKMVDFFTEGKKWPDFVRGKGSPYMASSGGAKYPVFAAECAGGVNRGGYNIDTDDRGHLWVNGHRVQLRSLSTTAWEGAYHGVSFLIVRDGGDLIVSFTGRNRANGICNVVAQ